MIELKVVVSSSGPDLEAQVDPRFGRCQYLVIVDTVTMDFEAIPNVSAGAMSGAGIQAAQMVVEKGVQAVITGNVGPNAFQVLSSAGIKVMIGASGTVRSAVDMFNGGGLSEALAPGPGHVGMGRGMGRGGGMGMGRGMGASQPPPYSQTSMGPSIPAPPVSREQEVSMLELQLKSLQQQLEQIKKRLDDLKGSTSR